MKAWERELEKPINRRDSREVLGVPWLLESDPDHIPDNEMQAIMEAAPNEPIRTDKQTISRSQERAATLLETSLSPEERAVIEATVMAGHSIRTAAKILGWSPSMVARLKTQGLDRLRKLMEDDIADDGSSTAPEKAEGTGPGVSKKNAPSGGHACDEVSETEDQ